MNITQSSFPDVWSSECDQKRVKVEVQTPAEVTIDSELGVVEDLVSEERTWITIPTTGVKQYETKDGVAGIQRTAKVTFPTVWGEDSDDVLTNNTRRIITEYNSLPFRFVRIWYKDDNGRYNLTHFGFAGGVGPTATPGESKMWVYDIAEMLEGLPVNLTFNDPNVNNVLQSVVDKMTADDSLIPLVGAIIVPPLTEESIRIQARRDIEEDPFGELNNLIGDDETVMYYYMQEYLEYTPEQFGQDFSNQILYKDTIPFIGNVDPEVGPELVFVSAILGPFASQISVLDQIDDFLSTKRFSRNHDTVMDVLNWLSEKTQSVWHFEPVKNGVILVVDIVPERRVFASERVYNDNPDEDTLLFDGYDGYNPHELVRVNENNSLQEMNPVNTVNLRGSSPGTIIQNLQDFDLKGAWDTSIGPYGNMPDKSFPVVKVRIPSLYEAAENTEIAPRTIESDAVTLGEAQSEAKTILREQLEEVGEGEIIIRGHPRINPYDRIDAYEVCGVYIDTQPTPIMYEVETVEHIKMSGDFYITKLQCSIFANDRTMEVIESRLEDLKDGN